MTRIRIAAAVLLLPAALAQAPAAAASSAPGAPSTCLPHCDNALYPYTEYAKASAEAVLPGSPPQSVG